ncbi:hypothetical protein AAVH_22819 [Aphelenchoides avenae]|nr:hypothetical protein AAVH_22819 [Aphelenchus avenae]
MQAAATGPGIRQQPTAAQLADEQMKSVITTAEELTRRLNDLKTAQARIIDLVNKADLGEDAARHAEFSAQLTSISEAANEAYE